MKNRLLVRISASVFLFCLGILAVPVNAQHCPYDGGNMVVVKLTDAKGRVITDGANDLSLHEIDNPVAKTCAFASGLLDLSFKSPIDAFLLEYENQGTKSFERYCEGCSFKGPGFYAVILGQAEQQCMIPTADGHGYERYIPRKFEVRYSSNGTVQTMIVPKDRIYGMCTNYGKWSRMEPVTFQIKTANKRKTSLFRSFDLIPDLMATGLF